MMSEYYFLTFYDNQSNDNQMSPHYNWMQHNINFDLETMLEIKKTLINSDIKVIYTDTNISDTLNDRLKSQNIHALVPISKSNQINGFLALGDKDNYIFNDDDDQFIQIIASFIQISFDRLKPYEKIKQEYLIGKKRTEEMAEHSAYAQITRGIAHEIKNPFALLLASSELLLENISDKDFVEKLCASNDQYHQ